MIKRIRVAGYKSLEKIDVELTPPLSVLFGPNGVGKSNFLDALQLLSGLVTRKTIKDAFLPPYRGTPLESFSFGTEGIPGSLKRESIEFEMEVDIELSKLTIDKVSKLIRNMRTSLPGDKAEIESTDNSPIKEKSLRYTIRIAIKPSSGVVQVADECLMALTSKGVPSKSRAPFLESQDQTGKLHLRMEGQAHPTYYERYLDYSLVSLPHYPPHYPHLVAFREELASWLFFYFEPRERMRSSNPVKEVYHIGMMGEDLAAFLNTLKSTDEKRFNAVERALRSIIPSITGIEVKTNNFGEVELYIREGSISVPARLISEGTLRILGLLSLVGAKESPTLIGFEEPENGIHPRRIRLIAELLTNEFAFQNSQLIVTTHSPLLPDKVPTKSLLVCKRNAGRTEIIPLAPWGDLDRANQIAQSFDGDDQNQPSISQRILRGDFDS